MARLRLGRSQCERSWRGICYRGTRPGPDGPLTTQQRPPPSSADHQGKSRQKATPTRACSRSTCVPFIASECPSARVAVRSRMRSTESGARRTVGAQRTVVTALVIVVVTALPHPADTAVLSKVILSSETHSPTCYDYPPLICVRP